jgi:hypothetical protein
MFFWPSSARLSIIYMMSFVANGAATTSAGATNAGICGRAWEAVYDGIVSPGMLHVADA